MAYCVLNGITVTPTDSKGNTWTQLTARGQGGGAVVRFAYCKPTSVGTGHTFTINSGANSFPGVAVASFSGGNATPFDVENGAVAAGSGTLATGSVTPSVNNELVVSCLGDAWTGTVSVNSGTILNQLPLVGGTSFAIALAYELQTTAAARNPVWTMNARAEAAIATFKP